MALTLEETVSLPDDELLALGLSPDEIKAMRLLKTPASSHYKFRISDLWIQTKSQKIVRFSPNSTQRQFLESIGLTVDTEALSLKGMRRIILKSRQFGFSTLILALVFLNTINNENTNTVIIAHDLESTIVLFRMVSRFYDKLPDGKPLTQYQSKREIFWPTINSRISVETAGKGTAGRGNTIHNLAISEFAFWEDDNVLTGLLQAVPAGGPVFIESTANGVGGAGAPFYNEYALASGKIEEAKDGRKYSIFEAHFYPWHWHEEYQSEPEPGFTPDDKEQSLAKTYGLTSAQLQWRRNKMAEPGMGESRFVQEYPINDDEAFRASGIMFFERFEAKPPHVVTPIFTPDAPPPSWYVPRGGLDWGLADPFAYVISVIDERGRKHILESYEETRLTNEEQANLICAALARWKIAKSRFVLIADGSMWNQKTINGVKFPPDIEAFEKAGLNCEKAAIGEDANKFRNNRIRDEINDNETGMIIYRGYNSRLIECLLSASHDPLKREKLLHDDSSHLVVALGNCVSTYDTPRGKDPNVTNKIGYQRYLTGKKKAGSYA